MIGFQSRLLAAALLFVLAFAPSVAAPVSQLITYPYPRPVRYHPGDALRDPYRNNDYTVRVRLPGGAWKDLYEHNVKVDWNNPQNATMVNFDFSGAVEVAIEKNNGVFSKVRIRPNALGLKSRVRGNIVSFVLRQPQNLSVEFDGDRLHNLHIFAGDAAIAAKRPAPGPNVVIYGPGVHTPENGAEAFTAQSGQTIYIDGGAVLEAPFSLLNVHDVTIIGHGLIEQPRGGFSIKYSSNIHIEGLTFLNPAHGTLQCLQSQHVTLRDIKTFSAGAWGDGINVYSCQDVSLDKAFIRTSDDCFTVYAHRNDTYGDARHIRVTDSILWPTTAHAMFVGLHGNSNKPETIEDVVFRNIDVLGLREDQADYQGVMGISAGDDNLVRNVTFENIRVDDILEGKLIQLRVTFNEKYNTSPGRGIENVTFRHIRFSGDGMADASVVMGYDEVRQVRGIRFEDVWVGGKRLTKPERGLLEIGPFVQDVTYR